MGFFVKYMQKPTTDILPQRKASDQHFVGTGEWIPDYTRNI